MSIEELYKIYQQYPSVQTDTRKLKPGDIFFALKGPNFNGNAFAKQAIDAGAVCAVIDEKDYEIPGKTFLVHDALTALQQLAHHHRRQFHIPFLAITGSNGKTTTKELIHAVMSSAYNVYTTQGNLNNHIGVPLTILKVREDANMAVIEMGANHLHEIEGYCKIAEPTHGLITNCGKAHLEGFGSLEGVKRGKGELFEHIRNVQGTAFVMWDYDYLRELSAGIEEIVSYGTRDAAVTGSILQSSPFLRVKIDPGIEIQTQLVGDYNLPNVLAAVAVGREMKISMSKIKDAIEAYAPSNSRSQLVQHGTNKFILDAYNANPSSMQLAIENFAAIQEDKKVLMLGAMAEMGRQTEAEHQRLVDLIKQYKWHAVLLVGSHFERFKNEFIYFENADAAGAWFAQQNFTGTYFLVKGSRSSHMEKILAAGNIAGT